MDSCGFVVFNNDTPSVEVKTGFIRKVMKLAEGYRVGVGQIDGIKGVFTASEDDGVYTVKEVNLGYGIGQLEYGEWTELNPPEPSGGGVEYYDITTPGTADYLNEADAEAIVKTVKGEKDYVFRFNAAAGRYTCVVGLDEVFPYIAWATGDDSALTWHRLRTSEPYV